MSAPLVRHGWTIAFQPQLFARQYVELKAEVKLLAAVMEGIKERIAADPYACRFALSGPLRRYGRLKGLGLPDRYRLFFRPFEAEDRRLLLILWLGFPRKDGDRNDCYAVFSRLVQRGELPEDWESRQRLAECRAPLTSVASNPVPIHWVPVGPTPGLNELHIPGLTGPMRLTRSGGLIRLIVPHDPSSSPTSPGMAGASGGVFAKLPRQ
jgi:toxin YhaV